jgi:hypothetical protein
MPAITTLNIRARSRIWEGDCPAQGCDKSFRIKAPAWAPKFDVLKAFKSKRPRGRHVHGDFWIDAYRELGGE